MLAIKGRKTNVTEVLKGKPVADAIVAEVTERVADMKQEGITPCLAVVRMGEEPGDVAYENSVIKKAGTLGIAVERYCLAREASQQELLAVIEEINTKKEIHGALLFRPFPKQIDDLVVRSSLLPQKDMDGISQGSLAGVFTATAVGYPPCTAQACMEMLSHYGIVPKGKRAVVIGRSLVIGRPVAMLLMHKNATVTICHTKTQEVAKIAKEADIVIASAGSAAMVTKEFAREGQVILDVGVNAGPNGSIVGDVATEEVMGVTGSLSPVPGGVGAVTTAQLMKHVVLAAEATLQSKKVHGGEVLP